MKEMKSSVVLMIVFVCCVLSSSTRKVSAHLRERRNSPQPSEITVTLKIEWNVTAVGKPIPASYITKVKNGTVLVDILNKAAGNDKRSAFNKYDSTYYGGLGYLITAMNGTKQDPATNTYWKIFDEETGELTPCGVSSYVPVDKSKTIFRFTQASANYSASGYCKSYPVPQVITSPITVTIGLDWNVTSVGKPVPAAYTTQVNDGTVLVDIMNKAADENGQGPFNKWESTYFGGLGHFITALDGVEQDPQTNTYWMIYDNKTGKLTPLGVDGYQPKDDSVTVFRLVTGASHEATTSRPTETLTESSGHKFVGLGLVFLCLLAAIEGLLFL